MLQYELQTQHPLPEHKYLLHNDNQINVRRYIKRCFPQRHGGAYRETELKRETETTATTDTDTTETTTVWGEICVHTESLQRDRDGYKDKEGDK